MNDERFDAWSRRLTENGSRRHVMRLMAGGALGIALARRALPTPAIAFTTFAGGLGYPAARPRLADYTERVMNSKGYVRVSPRAGAIMVYDRSAKCASSCCGHMALVRSATYNSTTKKWAIYVDDANWGSCGIRQNRFAGTCADWGNLWGVNFYVRR